jgi:hypothetical protein
MWWADVQMLDQQGGVLFSPPMTAALSALFIMNAILTALLSSVATAFKLSVPSIVTSLSFGENYARLACSLAMYVSLRMVGAKAPLQQSSPPGRSVHSRNKRQTRNEGDVYDTA